MARRSAFRNQLEHLAVRAALRSLARQSPEDAMHTAGRWMRLLDRAVPRLRRVAFRNLELALPEADPAPIIDGCFRSLGRVLAATAHFPRITRENVHEWIVYDGFSHFEEALSRGRGVLFATGHLGNWELSAFTHALMAAPMSFVVRPLDNPLLDALSTRYRALSGNRILGRRDFLRALVEALHRNEAAGILIDQNVAAGRGVFIDFFGRKACVDAGFARLAHRTGAAVIPGFALWDEAARRHVLKFYPPVPMTGDALADTQAVHHVLEDAIRAHPDQWLWIHRRWKTRPPGEPDLY
ncbi:MAG TPA: lysophospholipid acyltransferase family protein [Bryobacteraceae bacterium]|nr:lipid A biosynthesis acyltransferase [Bryobacterales bacterium]HRJ21506.1 lysophospholipid acyltransferase family protein [Bryobacteraceae bacterium]